MYLQRMFLVVTEACDCRCLCCGYWRRPAPRRLEMDFFHRAVLPFVGGLGLKVTCITGGEPTLHPELVGIAAALKEAGSLVTLTTNTGHLGVHFPALRPLVDFYLVSLDGPDRESYRAARGSDRFAETCDWLRRIRSESPAQAAVSFVLQRANFGRLREMYELCRALEVDRLFIRVPDLKPHTFGRTLHESPGRRDYLAVTEAEVDELGRTVDELLLLDADRGLIGQSRRNLHRKVAWYRCIARGEPYREEDACCDVPLTSFVVEPGRVVRPCFYLPESMTLNGEAPRPETLAAQAPFTAVYRQILYDREYRLRWCNSCQQFDGHKHEVCP